MDSINKLNILLVHNYYKLPGGEDTVFKNEYEMLKNKGHNVFIYSRNNKEIDNFNFLKKALLAFDSVYNKRTYKDIIEIIKKEKIDIVHVHNTLSLISPSVYYAAIDMNVPVVQTIHNFRLICPGGMLYRNNELCEECLNKGLKCAVKHKCYRNSRFQSYISASILKHHRKKGIYSKINYICLTEFNKEKISLVPNICKEKIFVKPNFSTSIVSHALDSSKRDGIVYVGRLEHIKGVELLINTWKQYGARLPKLKLYGKGPLDSWCRETIKNEKIENIEVKGQREHSFIIDEISKSKALILPTQVYEGFPMTIVEAFSVGTPVLCTNMGNAGSLVKNDFNGFKFESNPESIYDAINNMVNKNFDYNSILEHYKENYSEEKNYSILMDIYKKII